MKAEQPVPESIDEYIASFPDDVQTVLQKVRRTIAKAAPDATEVIKYRLPTFVLNGNLVHFGAFRNHIGLYALPEAHAEFRAELLRYRSGKGSVQFPLDKPIPFELIARIVKFRVQENMAAVAAKKKRR